MDDESSRRDADGEVLVSEDKELSVQNPPAQPSNRTTIFVGNLPFDTTDQQLEKEFSEIGPIKRAFIVKDKDKNSRSRGCGYIQFVIQEDADKCATTSKIIGNRKLRLSYANKKPKHQKRKALAEKALQTSPNNEDPLDKVTENTSSNAITKVKENPEEGVIKPLSGNKTDIQKTIVLTGLTTKVKRKAFRILCEEFGEIENIVYPVPEKDDVTAFVRFKDYKSAIRASQKITGRKVKKSGILSACLLTKENKHPSKKSLQKSRLIIRNLSFKCEEQDLLEAFSKFGKVIGVNIPTKKVNSKDVKIGCAFVQYANTENAKAALEEMNLKEIKGRQVVIDWAITKELYEKRNSADQSKPDKDSGDGDSGGKSDKKKNEVVQDDEETHKGKSDDDIDDNNDVEEEEGDDSFSGQDDNEMEGDGNISDQNDDDSDEREEQEDDVGVSDEDIDNDDDDIDEDDQSDDGNIPNVKPKRELKDAKEGKTIFIRNLSYNVDEDMLSEEFEKYGEIDYCKLVIDHESGRSKGTAFIKFKEKNSADECMKEFIKKEESDVNTLIDGRKIMVSLAVTKGKLGEIQNEKSESKKEGDKRNLYLALEGSITRNSPAAEGLTDAELKKREKLLAQKRAKLKNPNFFVSRTRLCIRNLPLTTDDDGLRTTFMKHVSRQMKIKEVKIMRSKERRDVSGMPRSLGFGFIDVESHEDALAMLRATNNNPDIFGAKRRPMVEFSVENAKALKILELKKKRLEQKRQNTSENNDEDMTKKDKNVIKQRIYEKRVKRIARYKRKKEKKKLLNQNENLNQEDGIKAPVKDVAKAAKSVSIKNNVTLSKTDEYTNTSDRQGFKRKLPSELDNPVKQKRNLSKKKDKNEEEKFNSMVKQYKQKLFGNVSQTSDKRGDSRWFE